MASLGFVYGLLLGNCGYQTYRNRSSLAILALSARCARDKIINSLRENEAAIELTVVFLNDYNSTAVSFVTKLTGEGNFVKFG